MGEPGPAARSAATNSTIAELLTLLHHEYPQAQLERSGNQWAVYTLHSVGASEEEAIMNAVTCCRRMKEDGRSLPQILDDVEANLKGSPGMSKDRHSSLTELLSLAQNCLNDGVLTKTVDWIMVPSHTRRIETLQRRVDERLAMTAKEMADMEKARIKAGTKAVGGNKAEYTPGVGYTKPVSHTGTLWDLFAK